MSNAVERMRLRKPGAVIVSVPWSLGQIVVDGETKAAHDFNLKVNVFAQSELNNAVDMTKEALAKRLIEEPADDADRAEKIAYNHSFNLEYWGHVGRFVRRHISGWEHTPNDGSAVLAFSKPVLDALFDELTITDAQMVGLGYLVALEKEQKKRLSQDNTGPGL